MYTLHNPLGQGQEANELLWQQFSPRGSRGQLGTALKVALCQGNILVLS